MTPPADPQYVRITVQGTKLSAVYLLDDTPPALDNGYGGWQDQPRDRRRALAVWSGPASWTQTISVILNAYAEGRDAAISRLRTQWDVLQALWSIPGPTDSPPLATLEGKTLMLPAAEGDPHTNWALTDVAPREILRASADDGVNAVRGPREPVSAGAAEGEMVRWAGTLTFTRVAPRQILRITAGPHAGTHLHVVVAGETLTSIAKSEKVALKEIRWAKTGKPIRDPKTKVKVGDRLRIPNKSKAKK